jgi:hypothetical protein
VYIQEQLNGELEFQSAYRTIRVGIDIELVLVRPILSGQRTVRPVELEFGAIPDPFRIQRSSLRLGWQALPAEEMKSA